MTRPISFGIDLGGTKMEIIALGPDGRELLRRRRPTPRGSYEATLDGMVALVLEAEEELGSVGSVGICHPGAISPGNGQIKNANLTWLNGRRFDQDLMDRMKRPVAFANDANCLALSEATDGAGAGAPVVFTAILGTGVGGGIVVNGQLLTGPNAIGGEWGHIPLPATQADELPGPACYCGRFGCVETWLSGPALAMDHRQRFGADLSAPEIVEKAQTGDHACDRSMNIYEDRLARALGTIMSILDPDVIVLAGGLSNASRIYANVPRRWHRYTFSDDIRTRLLPPVHGDSSGVRGAAWLGRSLADG
ncbi:ROK family protein [Geminicoccus roseus]|uniref:ROK family protein n=1 Tax=Geminicoccus roseus TaxID=404900 RepID=UPI0004273C0F|nr:ROK family protein [Geminicoccus roseus]